MKNKLSLIFIACGVLLVLLSVVYFAYFTSKTPAKPTKSWNFQSIDTMKYSRDLSREKLEDNTFDTVIDSQVKEIALAGATHVAIATPYDSEFLPVLRRWVKAAREYKLKVWFRGNFSGWEEWFDYKKITREEHMEMTREFIENNADLFEDGDVFTACPECENGGNGDPRIKGDVEGHRQFLIDEYTLTKNEFEKIGKKVVSNYDSMNKDVAELVMDPATTQKLGGIVTIDHYVATPQQLNDDVTMLARKSGGKIVLGEFGVPIPDINGDMKEEDQALWIHQALSLLSKNKNLVGLNYWVGEGGSTELWKYGVPKKAVASIQEFYTNSITY